MARSPTDVMVRRRCEHRPRAVVLRAVDAVVDEVGHPRRARLAAEVVAELVEEDDAAAVLVDLAELRVRIRHLDAAEGQNHPELLRGQPAVVAVALVEDPEQLVEVEEVNDQALELLLMNELVLPLHGLLVAAHERGLVVQQGVVLHDELVDLRQRHDVVAIEVQAPPRPLQALLVVAEGLDLVLEVVEVLEGLGLHHVVQGRAVAAGAERLVARAPRRRGVAAEAAARAAGAGGGGAPAGGGQRREVDVPGGGVRRPVAGDAMLRVPSDVAGVLLHVAVAGAVAVLPAQDVRVELGVVVGVHAVPDVCAELDEEDLAAVVGVDLLELLLCLLRRHLQAQRAHAGGELAAVDAAVGARVDLLEDLEQLGEPEDVQQQRVELGLLDPVVAVAVLQGGLLVGAHEGRLRVQPLRPRAPLDHLDDHLVDLGQADDVVPVVVQAAPQLLQVRGVDEAVGPHVRVQGHAQLHELVVARREGGDLHVRIRAPLAVGVADLPLVLAVRGRLAFAGLAVGPTLVAVVHDLADDPAALARVEEVAGRDAPRHPSRGAVVLHLHGLVGVADKGEPRRRRPALDLDRGGHGLQALYARARARLARAQCHREAAPPLCLSAPPDA
mmetsp:Transcript_91454/g.255459  ORF Transcript_91454/g.255459 Transcript_91454/m.255459 type:complete len:613 (+) Transcript_91454:72-1910(+)